MCLEVGFDNTNLRGKQMRSIWTLLGSVMLATALSVASGCAFEEEDAGLETAEASTSRFQIRCLTSHVAQDDPIVAPGAQSAHLHEFFCNETTSRYSNYDSMIVGGTTASTPLDTSGVWVPTLIGSGGKVVRAKSVLIYYRGVPGATTLAFPPDLRMISHQSTIGATTENFIIRFPSCWDGVHIDSPDHMSHMAFSTGKGCPASHPVLVPEVTVLPRYAVSVTGHTLSSGALSTMHGDFWNTWDQDGLEALVDRCLNGTTSCPRID